MKDTEEMNKEEKHRYIFEDTSFEGRPRFNWITDCLLGDIRTFLDGIEYFIIQKKGEPAGKRPRGGGNLSVPILIHTALEFVSRLYVGETKFNGGYNATENAKKFIMRYFPEKYKEIPLLLWDGIRNGLIHTFSPKPFTYKGNYIRFQFYVEDQNFPSHIEKVKGFLFGIDIDAKFETKLNNGDVPEELENNFKTMNLPLPNTIWKEGTYWELTDGVDTLYALEKEDKEKINVYNYIIQIRINVFELFRVLEKAIETYRAELENSDELQDKFIRAWSSIEDYQRDITKDPKKSREAEALFDYLDLKSPAFLLKDLNARLSVDLLKIYSFNSLKIRRS